MSNSTGLRERPTLSSAFRKRRAINWLSLGFTYSAMYMARYNFGFANKSLSTAYGFDKTQIGSIISAGLLVYAISAVFNGPISDRIGGRRSMLIGAIGTVIFNLLFGLGAYLGFLGTGAYLLGYLVVIWALNMYFQSYSALSLIKVNAAWFHVQERGVFSAIFGAMIQGGRALIFAVGPLLIVYFRWQWVFFVPSVLVAIMAWVTYLNVRDLPEDCGLAPLDVQDASSGDTGPVTTAYVLKKVYTSPVLMTIAVAEFCTGFVRHGFEQWFPRYIQEVQHMDLGAFVAGGSGIVFAGLAGAFAAGILSDWAFKGRRPPVAFLGYLMQVLSLAVVWRAPALSWVLAAFIVNSFGISMVHSMLSGTASMDFGGKKAAATAAGLLDGMQYFGGSFVGIGTGWLLDRFGWGAWAPSMIGFSLIGLILMAFLWNARPNATPTTRPAAH